MVLNAWLVQFPRQRRFSFLTILCLLCFLCLLRLPSSVAENGAKKTASSRYGMAAAGTPHATRAAVEILEAGGNAVDAAVAAAFVQTVADPAMTSLAGRAQMLIYLRGTGFITIDGATESPAATPPPEDSNDRREGYQLIPVPGNPAALSYAVSEYGRLALAQVLAPAIRLAEEGFVVSPRAGEIWEAAAEDLKENAGARMNYLKEDGSPYRAGERFRHPRLAAVLRRIAEHGPAGFYRGPVAEAMAEDMRNNGGYITLDDLANYRVQPGVLVRTHYRNYEIVSLGRHAWGNTLAEMLNILAHFELRRAPPNAREVELLARTIAQAIRDRPQITGTLAPKPDGLPLETLSSLEFARMRAEEIAKAVREKDMQLRRGGREPLEHDTTHLSVMDAEGNAVALTTSIGPRFGTRIATPELGFLYAHSYRMRSDPEPFERDLTEMTPTIVLRQGGVWLAIGAAGSERIPGAIAQVISYLVDRGYPLDRAVAAPRIHATGTRMRLHEDFPASVIDTLRQRGFRLEYTKRGPERHLGIVQAVLYDAHRGVFVGAADPSYDGTAAGPARAPQPVPQRNSVNAAVPKGV